MPSRPVVLLLTTAAVLAGVLAGGPAQAAGRAAGCAPNAAAIPAGAARATIPDIDGDGRPDLEYYTEALPGGGYDYGVRTASGHLARIHETMPGPGDHGGWTARIVHGTVIAVVDDGRSARLFSFRGCSFHPVENVQRRQYTFSVAGYTGPGTGVVCVRGRGGLWLYGEQATRRPGGTWDVERTHVIVSADGATARNGAHTVVGRRLPYSDPRVAAAFGSRCGSIVRVHNSGN